MICRVDKLFDVLKVDEDHTNWHNKSNGTCSEDDIIGLRQVFVDVEVLNIIYKKINFIKFSPELAPPVHPAWERQELFEER